MKVILIIITVFICKINYSQPKVFIANEFKDYNNISPVNKQFIINNKVRAISVFIYNDLTFKDSLLKEEFRYDSNGYLQSVSSFTKKNSKPYLIDTFSYSNDPVNYSYVTICFADTINKCVVQKINDTLSKTTFYNKYSLLTGSDIYYEFYNQSNQLIKSHYSGKLSSPERIYVYSYLANGFPNKTYYVDKSGKRFLIHQYQQKIEKDIRKDLIYTFSKDQKTQLVESIFNSKQQCVKIIHYQKRTAIELNGNLVETFIYNEDGSIYETHSKSEKGKESIFRYYYQHY